MKLKSALFALVPYFDDICHPFLLLLHLMETEVYFQLLPGELARGLREGEFNNPFRYEPCAAVQQAASDLMTRIGESPELSEAFRPGKMLGVLVVRDRSGRLGYLSGFSGLAAGKSRIGGFVTPIFDLAEPGGHYRQKEAEITAIVGRIRDLQQDGEYIALQSRLSEALAHKSSELETLRARMDLSRRERETERALGAAPERLAEMARQSQFEKAEFRRAKMRLEKTIESLQSSLNDYAGQIGRLRQKHREMSDNLQKWIFDRYVVHNSCGEASSVSQIFADKGLVPPGGTGECAAPKLLEFAFRNALEPLAMGEFWYGEPSRTAVRVQGHFYPSCTSKCGPLLGFMLKGMLLRDVQDKPSGTLRLLYEDADIIVAAKPSGVPSVPGLDGRKSMLEMLRESCGGEVYAVHRLDMDTSGIMVYARNLHSQAALQRQFESRTVSKTYRARLCPPDPNPAGHNRNPLAPDRNPSAPDCCTTDIHNSGTISLPLSPDYDERPRQRADLHSGKQAVTRYRILSTAPDGTSEILFHPLDGRTHQLRVHSAHALGLSRPIAGDLLYGGNLSGIHRLCLHACSLSFNHPSTGERLLFDDGQ